MKASYLAYKHEKINELSITYHFAGFSLMLASQSESGKMQPKKVFIRVWRHKIIYSSWRQNYKKGLFNTFLAI